MTIFPDYKKLNLFLDVKKLGQNYYEGDARGTIAREMGEIGGV